MIYWEEPAQQTRRRRRRTTEGCFSAHVYREKHCTRKSHYHCNPKRAEASSSSSLVACRTCAWWCTRVQMIIARARAPWLCGRVADTAAVMFVMLVVDGKYHSAFSRFIFRPMPRERERQRRPHKDNDDVWQFIDIHSPRSSASHIFPVTCMTLWWADAVPLTTMRTRTRFIVFNSKYIYIRRNYDLYFRERSCEKCFCCSFSFFFGLFHFSKLTSQMTVEWNVL